MPFDPSPADMLIEIQEAQKRRESHYQGVPAIDRRYVGSRYSTSSREGRENDPDAYAYSYVSLMLPSIVHQPPAVELESQRVAGEALMQAVMEQGVGAWVRQTDFMRELTMIVMDKLFFQGVAMVSLVADRQWAGGRVMPKVSRIRPDRFMFDAVCDRTEESKWLGHEFFMYSQTLMDDPDVLPGAKQAASTLSQYADRRRITDAFKRIDPTALNRRMVRVYSAWLRETNEIRVYAEGGAGLTLLYEPYSFYGPDDGPYVTFDGYPVRNEPYPLSPLVAIEDQVQSMQDHLRAADRSAQNRKKFAIADSGNKAMGQAMQQANEGDVWMVPGFHNTQFAEVELGGVTDTQLAHIDRKRELTDRSSGMSEIARGMVGTSKTATEAAIANEGTDTRLSFLRNSTDREAGAILTKVGWYLWHTDGVALPLTVRNEFTGETYDALFLGGQTEGQEGGGGVAQWSDFAVKVVPNSMQKSSQALLQQNRQQVMGTVTEAAAAMPAMPHVRWIELLNSVGDTLDFPDMGDRFINMEALGGVNALGNEGLQTPASAGQTPPNRAQWRPRASGPTTAGGRVGTPAGGQGVGGGGVGGGGSGGAAGGGRPAITQARSQGARQGAARRVA